MFKDYFLRLSLNWKLAGMMLLLSLSLMAVLMFLYYETEKAMYSEFERHIAELTGAIKLGVEEVTSSGVTDETRLKNYLQALNTRGVREISLISTSDRIVSSTNPSSVGKWITKQKKELIFKAELGDPSEGDGHAYNIIIPVVAGGKHFGYVHLTINAEDFSVFMRTSVIRRMVAASIVLIIGLVLSVFLARRYTKPIEEVVSAARSVARGDLTKELITKRKDEIGELAGGFNYMVGKLRQERELSERLRKAEHMASIGQFSSSIAHEIKNPLNFISLSIDHMREKYRPPTREEQEKFDSLIQNIKKELQRVSRFSESFLEYSRPLELSLRMTDMGGLLEGVLELVSARAVKENVSVERQYEAMAELNVDPEFIKTCLYNIILNAFEAMPGGGTLRVITKSEAGKFIVSIEDTGKGISAEKAKRVFEPFFSTKERGLGLGLALTKRVIEEHGGKVQFKSSEDKGTAVTLILPGRTGE